MSPRKLTEQDVEFTLEIGPEWEGPEGYFASGDDEADAETCQQIRDDLDDGNDWAWCVVTVTARWKTFTGSASLGACSYASEQDFREGDYHETMKAEALDALNQQLSDAFESARDLL